MVSLCQGNALKMCFSRGSPCQLRGTPLSLQILEIVTPWLQETFANPLALQATLASGTLYQSGYSLSS